MILITILGYLTNRARKRRMTRALGHQVNEYEANSISSWIKVAENEEKK